MPRSEKAGTGSKGVLASPFVIPRLPLFSGETLINFVARVEKLVSGNVRIGQCKLTMMRGRYVKAHIIPEALTETSWMGQPLTQKGRNGRHIRRWTSWYDNRLVTADGEAILAK